MSQEPKKRFACHSKSENIPQHSATKERKSLYLAHHRTMWFQLISPIRMLLCSLLKINTATPKILIYHNNW